MLHPPRAEEFSPLSLIVATPHCLALFLIFLQGSPACAGSTWSTAPPAWIYQQQQAPIWWSCGCSLWGGRNNSTLPLLPSSMRRRRDIYCPSHRCWLLGYFFPLFLLDGVMHMGLIPEFCYVLCKNCSVWILVCLRQQQSQQFVQIQVVTTVSFSLDKKHVFLGRNPSLLDLFEEFSQHVHLCVF